MNFQLFIKAAGIAIVAFILSFVCYLLSGDAFVYKEPEFLHNLSIKVSYHTSREPVSFVDVNRVVIKAINTDVNLKSANPGSKGAVDVTTGGDEDKAFHLEKDHQTLFITQNSAGHYPDTSITIALPAAVKTIKVQNTSGDVQLEKTVLNEVEINTLSGEIDIQEGTLQKARLQTMAGKVHSSATINDLVVKSVSGAIDIDVKVPEPVYQIDSVSGDVHLHGENVINANFNLHSVAGDVVNKAKIAISSKTQGTIKINTMSGNIKIQ